MYAIIESGGKQYKVSQGDFIYLEKLDAETDAVVTFDHVLAVFDAEEVKLGNPYVQDFRITGRIMKQGKQKKIIVFKMKPKKNYRRRQGHRQPYTKVRIESIAVDAVLIEEEK